MSDREKAPDLCPTCGSETGKRGWITIPPLTVGSVAKFGREELCTAPWHDSASPAPQPERECALCVEIGPIKLDTNRAGHIFIDQEDREFRFGTRVILTPQQAEEVRKFIEKARE